MGIRKRKREKWKVFFPISTFASWHVLIACSLLSSSYNFLKSSVSQPQLTSHPWSSPLPPPITCIIFRVYILSETSYWKRWAVLNGLLDLQPGRDNILFLRFLCLVHSKLSSRMRGWEVNGSCRRETMKTHRIPGFQRAVSHFWFPKFFYFQKWDEWDETRR